MHIKRSHTEEIGPNRFAKLEVGLDQDDVMRLLTEHLPGVDPHTVSVRDLFLLMEAEAALLLAMSRRSRFQMSESASEALLFEARDLQQFLAGHVEKLRVKHDLV